jgi:hypothetical protein
MNYEEIWYTKTIERSYDVDQSKVVDKTINGFDAFRTYSFSSSLGTTIYGTFNFGNDKKIKSIRHVMRPLFPTVTLLVLKNITIRTLLMQLEP